MATDSASVSLETLLAAAIAVTPQQKLAALDILRGNSSPTPASDLSSGVGKMRAYLQSEFGGVEESLKIISEKLDYLTDAAYRQGRKTWFHTCIGVVVSLLCVLGLSQDQGKALWGLLKTVVSGLVRFLPQ